MRRIKANFGREKAVKGLDARGCESLGKDVFLSQQRKNRNSPLLQGPMKITIEVRDDKAAFFLELLRDFAYVRLDEASAEKARILDSLAQGLKEAKMAERGELKLQSAREWLNEL
jgi:hypothetical protein